MMMLLALIGFSSWKIFFFCLCSSRLTDQHNFPHYHLDPHDFLSRPVDKINTVAITYIFLGRCHAIEISLNYNNNPARKKTTVAFLKKKKEKKKDTDFLEQITTTSGNEQTDMNLQS